AFGIDFTTLMLLQGPATGRSIVLVTPDAGRSMFTYLGAAQRLNEDDIDAEMIKLSKYIFLEGYLFDVDTAKKALMKAADLAHRFGRQVVFTLSQTGNMAVNQAQILDFIKNKVDILFANEREIKNLYGINDLDEIVRQLKSQVNLASITLGDKGAIALDGTQTVRVEAKSVEEVVDTTGAGDLYASGFIHGLLEGQSLKTCANMGCLVASEIITHYGARAETALKSLLKREMV
ncbi:MAG: adenosine kinase, partial [Alphaproteobacteria bacterium]|nr:adenosine kinase [Alphaproteobacteria bacterium]